VIQTDLQVLIQVIIILGEQGSEKKFPEKFNISQNRGINEYSMAISRKTDNDIKPANALIRKSNRTTKSECYIIDDGYDSAKNPFFNSRRNQSRLNYTFKRKKKVKEKYRKHLLRIFIVSDTIKVIFQR
jgi:hypothetical protein